MSEGGLLAPFSSAVKHSRRWSRSVSRDPMPGFQVSVRYTGRDNVYFIRCSSASTVVPVVVLLSIRPQETTGPTSVHRFLAKTMKLRLRLEFCFLLGGKHTQIHTHTESIAFNLVAENRVFSRMTPLLCVHDILLLATTDCVRTQ